VCRFGKLQRLARQSLDRRNVEQPEGIDSKLDKNLAASFDVQVGSNRKQHALFVAPCQRGATCTA
jgi:hypothetical protein